jgi:hypothetical protein
MRWKDTSPRLKRIYSQNPDPEMYGLEKLDSFTDLTEKLAYILNNEYLSGRWSLFLLKLLVVEIYNEKEGAVYVNNTHNKNG